MYIILRNLVTSKITCSKNVASLFRKYSLPFEILICSKKVICFENMICSFENMTYSKKNMYLLRKYENWFKSMIFMNWRRTECASTVVETMCGPRCGGLGDVAPGGLGSNILINIYIYIYIDIDVIYSSRYCL